jgi:hypothetical protein
MSQEHEKELSFRGNSPSALNLRVEMIDEARSRGDAEIAEVGFFSASSAPPRDLASSLHKLARMTISPQSHVNTESFLEAYAGGRVVPQSRHCSEPPARPGSLAYARDDGFFVSSGSVTLFVRSPLAASRSPSRAIRSP